ncbi:hypothetical protein HYV84_01040 [Candidatus Woesearchaeota archaeon]|nr:hypothetical protein [Candidatus Woesearchaeota archaeon]
MTDGVNLLEMQREYLYSQKYDPSDRRERAIPQSWAGGGRISFEWCNPKARISRIMEKISSRHFQDGLSGVYGKVDEKIFEKHKRAILDLA